MDKELKHNLTAGETWVRGLFILLFAFFLVIARIVTGAVVVIQFLFTVFTGKTNDNLRNLGAMLSQYVYQCLLFVTYNSDDKPFPFDDWPDAEILGEEKVEADTAIPTVKTTAKAKAEPKKKAGTRKKSTTKKAASTQSETQPEPEVSPEADAGSSLDEPGNKPGS
ncbi:DUF4389 domain-containing protein [Kaarinaea lacus]